MGASGTVTTVDTVASCLPRVDNSGNQSSKVIENEMARIAGCSESKVGKYSLCGSAKHAKQSGFWNAFARFLRMKVDRIDSAISNRAGKEKGVRKKRVRTRCFVFSELAELSGGREGGASTQDADDVPSF